MLQRLERGLYLESVNPHKETKAVVNTCNSNAGGGETGIHGACWPANIASW